MLIGEGGDDDNDKRQDLAENGFHRRGCAFHDLVKILATAPPLGARHGCAWATVMALVCSSASASQRGSAVADAICWSGWCSANARGRSVLKSIPMPMKIRQLDRPRIAALDNQVPSGDGPIIGLVAGCSTATSWLHAITPRRTGDSLLGPPEVTRSPRGCCERLYRPGRDPPSAGCRRGRFGRGEGAVTLLSGRAQNPVEPRQGLTQSGDHSTINAPNEHVQRPTGRAAPGRRAPVGPNPWATYAILGCTRASMPLQSHEREVG